MKPTCALRALLSLAPLLLPFHASAQLIEIGSAGIDGVTVKWLGTSGERDSVRTALQIEPFQLTLSGVNNIILSGGSILPLEATVSKNLTTGAVELTRFKAAALRAQVLQMFPAEVLTFYRDMDRGIKVGADLLNARIPISITKKGEITIYPGIDLGVRSYQGGDSISYQGAFVVEARASMALVESWINTGILARLRLEAVTDGMSGHEESAMGFMSFTLDEAETLHARIYGGVEHDSARESLGIPATNAFLGTGLFGTFGQ